MSIENYQYEKLGDPPISDFSNLKLVRKKKIGYCFVGSVEFTFPHNNSIEVKCLFDIL